MKNKISGIYAIVNKINKKMYIGSSKSVYNRWKQNHLPQLTSGNHYNQHLQNAWNKYGKDNFELKIIEECNIDIVFEREGYWIEHYKSWQREYGYNLTRIVDEKQVFSNETRQKMSDTRKQSLELDDYWKIGINKDILDLYNQKTSKNAIAIQLGITRSAVYSCLEQNGLYCKTGKGSEIKLTEEVKHQVEKLRKENKNIVEIENTTGVSETQLRRTETIGDGLYCTNKVKRSLYRTVTSEVIHRVEALRTEGKKWEEIEIELGVSRFALHQNGITKDFKNPLAHKGPKNKITKEIKAEIVKMHLDGKKVNEISLFFDVAKSTCRFIIYKNTTIEQLYDN